MECGKDFCGREGGERVAFQVSLWHWLVPLPLNWTLWKKARTSYPYAKSPLKLNSGDDQHQGTCMLTSCVCVGGGGGGCRGCVLLRDPVFAPKRVKDLPCKVCGLIVSTFNSTEKLPLDWIGNSMSPRQQLWVTCGSSFPLMESQLKCKSCKWKLFLMERGSCKHSQLY